MIKDTFNEKLMSTESGFVFTMAGAGQRAFLFGRLAHGRVAFTMAEILLSLTIIGVVAAITLPSLTGNINERTWNTQRKALYSRMSQAIALMPALNGYGTLTENVDDDGVATITADTATETFVTNGLAKVLKINNICNSEHLSDCGLPNKVIDLNGQAAFSPFATTLLDFNPEFTFSKALDSNGDGTPNWFPTYSQTNTKVAAFETANGESIAVYYNPNCKVDMGKSMENVQLYMCANFVYDLNGKKGPNTVGKDMGFITAMYPTDSVVVAPIPAHGYGSSMTFTEARQICKADEDERLPNLEELSSIFYNQKLVGSGIPFNDTWSGSLASNGYVKYIYFGTGHRNLKPKTGNARTLCIKRI